MKINGSLFGLNFSSKGMSIQRKKMDLISENIAKADNIRTENGEPYKRKFLKVEAEKNIFVNNLQNEQQTLRLQTTSTEHFSELKNQQSMSISGETGKINLSEQTDQRTGDVVYMPDNPTADEKGYVEMSNVNVINEMVDMIAATRSYEANLQAFNSAKQLAKDSLEI